LAFTTFVIFACSSLPAVAGESLRVSFCSNPSSAGVRRNAEARFLQKAAKEAKIPGFEQTDYIFVIFVSFCKNLLRAYSGRNNLRKTILPYSSTGGRVLDQSDSYPVADSTTKKSGFLPYSDFLYRLQERIHNLRT